VVVCVCLCLCLLVPTGTGGAGGAQTHKTGLCWHVHSHIWYAMVPLAQQCDRRQETPLGASGGVHGLFVLPVYENGWNAFLLAHCWWVTIYSAFIFIIFLGFLVPAAGNSWMWFICSYARVPGHWRTTEEASGGLQSSSLGTLSVLCLKHCLLVCLKLTIEMVCLTLYGTETTTAVVY